MKSAQPTEAVFSASIGQRLTAIARRPGGLWLETVQRPQAKPAWSYICAEPAVWLRGAGNFLEVLPGPRGDHGWLERVTRADPGPGDAYERLQVIVRRLRISPPESGHHSADGPPPFRGGLAGCFSYDLGRRFEEIPARLEPEVQWDFLLGLYDEVIAVCPGTATIRHESLPGSTGRLLQLWQDSGDERLKEPPPSAGIAGPLRSEMDQATHAAAVEAIREHICAGTIYQANLTFRFRAPCPEPEAALATFLRLRRDNPAPYAAYLDLPGTTIVSTSPESFLELHRSGFVRSRPIKGTTGRGAPGTSDDEAARNALLNSAKDRAELAMIVDLVRNDIGRVCSPGSVNRCEVLAAEEHPSIWHLVGDVSGQLGEGRDALDLLRACFPPGSCIGAPKLRAMAILEDLESSRRGPYTGAIGWVGLDGTMCLSVAIRTMLFSDGEVSYGVGGGIVYDSVAAAEWQEALLKGHALATALSPKHGHEAPSHAYAYACPAERRP